MNKSAALPRTAPFAPDEIALIDNVLARASRQQRAWLSGFLAGLDTADHDTASPVAAPTAKPNLTILYATESGNAEDLANTAKREAQKRGFVVALVDMAETTPSILHTINVLLVIASTWGEGEAPQRAAPFMRALQTDDLPALTSLDYAVLALGDSAYAKFCETGRQIDDRLAALGGKRIAQRVECDLDYEDKANHFIKDILSQLTPDAQAEAVIHVDFQRGEKNEISKAHPFMAHVAALHPLTSSRSEAETLHLELDLSGSGLSYEPGDTLGLAPQNDPELVEEIQKITGLSGDNTAYRALHEERDITTLTVQTINDYAALTNEPKLRELAHNELSRSDFLKGRQIIDLFTAFPNRLETQQLIALLRKLPVRYYSIASSQKLVGDAAHLAVAHVAYESAGRARQGVASGLIARRVRVSDTLPVHIKPNPHFRLPADRSTPLIMIGAGTGIAPYRAFLQEREATGVTAPSWLIFGHRRFTHDFLYQLEIQNWLKTGTLSTLDLAFSRDQPEKIYVQNVLQARADDVRRQLKQGAILYLCGDAKGMAHGVEATLINILGQGDTTQGQMALEALLVAGRYRKDVY